MSLTYNESPSGCANMFASHGAAARNMLADSITDALSGLMHTEVFFASYLCDRTEILCIWPDDPDADRITTAATDGRHIYLNAEFIGKCSLHEAIAVLAHEVSHDMLGHPARGRNWYDFRTVTSSDGGQTRPYVWKLMQIALDAEINSMLRKHKFKLPEPNISIPWVESAPGTLCSEDIYIRLFDEQKPKPEPEQGEGEGEGGEPGDEHGGFDAHMLPETPPTVAEEEDRKRALKSAVAAGKRAGSVPEDMERMVEELCSPIVDWTQVLKDLIVTRLGREALDFRRMNRRTYLLRGTIDPALKSNRCDPILFMVDVSGSTAPYIQQFLGEVASVAEELEPSAIYVLWCDTRVAGVDTLEHARASDVAGLTIKGGGGTNLCAGFAWADEHLSSLGQDVAAMVILTDSETPWPNARPPYHVICATTGPELRHPSWMEVVPIDEAKARR